MPPATAQHRAKLLPIAQSHSDPGVLLQPCNNSSKWVSRLAKQKYQTTHLVPRLEDASQAATEFKELHQLVLAKASRQPHHQQLRKPIKHIQTADAS